MTKTKNTDDPEFNNFLYEKFSKRFPVVSVEIESQISEFLGYEDSQVFVAKYIGLGKNIAKGNSLGISGAEWRMKQERIQLIHKYLSVKKRKNLRDAFTKSRNGKDAQFGAIRLPQHKIDQLKQDIGKCAGKITISKVVTYLIDNYLDDALAELSSPQANPLDSIQDNGVTCLECGWHGTYLTRHLKHKHSELSPEEYKSKWELPSDWNMVPRKFGKSSE